MSVQHGKDCFCTFCMNDGSPVPPEKRANRRVAFVTHRNDGLVIVRDDLGLNIPELQGMYRDVRDRILDQADEKTIFKDWRHPHLRTSAVFRQDDLFL